MTQPLPDTPDPTNTDPAGDGGVIRRVRRRTVAAAGIVASLGAVVALLGWWWPAWFRGAAGAVIGGAVVAVCVAGAVVLSWRARSWGVAAGLTRPAGAGERWVAAVCRDPVPLHSPRGRATHRWIARRLGAQVLAVRAAEGPLASGHAVLLHARADRLLPRADDRLDACLVGVRGPVLIRRAADGAIFVADRWLFSTL